MRRWGQVLIAVGMMVGMAGVVSAHEDREGMAPEVRAIIEKYHGLKRQLHEECRQKAQALRQQEHQELEAARQAAHEKRAEDMKAHHEERMKHRDKAYEEHKARREEHWNAHHGAAGSTP